MTTPRTRALVSLTATIAVTLALAACAPGRSVPAVGRPLAMDGRLLTVAFDNDGREHVHVYLVDGRQGQWLLGRIDPWSQETLRIPAAALVGSKVCAARSDPGERLTPRPLATRARCSRSRSRCRQRVSAVKFVQGAHPAARSDVREWTSAASDRPEPRDERLASV